MDVDFSLLDIPESTKLNSDSSKHKRTVSKKGSFAHRKRPTRATTRPRSEEIAFVDSTEPGSLVQKEPSSQQIEGDEFRTEEPENSVNSDKIVQRRSEDSRRVPGLLEGLRTSKVLYKGQHTSFEPEPTYNIITEPASFAATLPAESSATPSSAQLDISVVACQNTSAPVLILPKSAPEISQKSEKTGDKVDIGRFSRPARRTDHPERSEVLGESTVHSHLPSTKVIQRSSPVKNFKSDVAIDTAALPFATTNQMSIARLQYSQGVHTTETSKSADLHDSMVLPLTETTSSEVAYQSYPTKFTSNATYKSTPESYSKTPLAIKSKEYTHQATSRGIRSFGAATLGPTDASEQSFSADVDKNTSANSRSKSDSKYWYNPTPDDSVASAKNSTHLNSSLVTVDISNTVDQKRAVESTLDSLKKLKFDKTIREIPEYVGGNYRQKHEHRNSQLFDNKRTDNGSVFNITGSSESDKFNRVHFGESTDSAVYNHDPDVLTVNAPREITFVCKLEPSFRGNKSVVDAKGNSINISDDLRESCLPIGVLQSESIPTRLAGTHPATERTAIVGSLPVSSGRILREGDITCQEERSVKEGMFTSSFSMQLRAGPRPRGNEFSGHGVETRVLPEKTFTFSFSPKKDGNTGLDVVRGTSGGQN
ncbi:hypothetical protein BsWGS_07460 [Bradybaena similaris]